MVVHIGFANLRSPHTLTIGMPTGLLRPDLDSKETTNIHALRDLSGKSLSNFASRGLLGCTVEAGDPS